MLFLWLGQSGDVQMGTDASYFLEVKPGGHWADFWQLVHSVTALLVCLMYLMSWDSVMTLIMSAKMPSH